MRCGLPFPPVPPCVPLYPSVSPYGLALSQRFCLICNYASKIIPALQASRRAHCAQRLLGSHGGDPLPTWNSLPFPGARHSHVATFRTLCCDASRAARAFGSRRLGASNASSACALSPTQSRCGCAFWPSWSSWQRCEPRKPRSLLRLPGQVCGQWTRRVRAIGRRRHASVGRRA